MRRVTYLLILCLLAPGAAKADPAGAREAGQRIAERWCAACHIVSADQRSGVADVLTFEAIAKKSEGDPASLKFFLADPHPVMPDMSLTRREIDDLVAYIQSLR